MNKMADTVIKRSNEAEKEEERRVLKYQNEKDERDGLKELIKKEETKRKYQEIKQKLDMQIQQKKAMKEHEFHINEDYMKQWM